MYPGFSQQSIESNQSRVIVYEPLKNDLQLQFSSGFFFQEKNFLLSSKTELVITRNSDDIIGEKIYFCCANPIQ
jgi:hypothetical protein